MIKTNSQLSIVELVIVIYTPNLPLRFDEFLPNKLALYIKQGREKERFLLENINNDVFRFMIPTQSLPKTVTFIVVFQDVLFLKVMPTFYKVCRDHFGKHLLNRSITHEMVGPSKNLHHTDQNGLPKSQLHTKLHNFISLEVTFKCLEVRRGHLDGVHKYFSKETSVRDSCMHYDSLGSILDMVSLILDMRAHYAF